MGNPYNTDLDRNPANYQPLTPITFLERAASVFPDYTAIKRAYHITLNTTLTLLCLDLEKVHRGGTN